MANVEGDSGSARLGEYVRDSGVVRVELVRAFSNPALRRHSLQLEINKSQYMNEATRSKHDGFAVLQKNLLTLVDAVLGFAASEVKRG